MKKLSEKIKKMDAYLIFGGFGDLDIQSGGFGGSTSFAIQRMLFSNKPDVTGTR